MCGFVCVHAYVCGQGKVMPMRPGMLPDHAGPPQFTAVRCSVLVKPEARADIGEPSAQNGEGIRHTQGVQNTHMPSHTWTAWLRPWI